MKKKILSVLFVIGACMNVHAQTDSSNDLTKFNLNGNVKSIEERTFKVVDSDNIYTVAISGIEPKWYFESFYTGNEDLPYQSSFFLNKCPMVNFKFNNIGNIVSQTYVEPFMGGVISYVYDEKGNRISEKWIMNNYSVYFEENYRHEVSGTSEFTIQHRYNSKNQLESSVYNEYAISKTYTYNVLGQITEEDLDGKVKITYTYNSENRISRVKVVENDDVYDFQYFYDSKGDVERMYSVGRYGEKQEWFFSYEYDSRGNWILRHEYFKGKWGSSWNVNNDELKFITTRKIDY
ncbi:MAG: hypothetical protein LBS69_01075 [Prevotellaceae bacterium]|jgi:hypothetical protein|nr:hypothetical protein [Prevotellaceae bacterium]